MNSQKKKLEEFDEFWSHVSSEIQMVQKREVIKQKLVVATKTLGMFMILLGLVFTVNLASERLDRKESCACDPWQIDGIRPALGVSAEYPLVCGKKIYALRVKGDDQRIVCIAKHEGTVLWESGFSVKDCRLIANDSRLFVLASKARDEWLWMALDPVNGEMLWQHSIKKDVSSSPSHLSVFEKGVCWSQGSSIFLAHTGTGEIIWSEQVDTKATLSAPEEYNGKILAAAGNNLYALNSNDGTIAWSQQYASEAGLLNKPMMSLDENRVFVARGFGRQKSVLWCMSADNGEILWQHDIPVPVNLQGAGGKVFVRSNGLKAFDASTGSLLWSSAIPGCSPVSFKDNLVLIANSQGNQRITGLNVETGEKVWVQDLSSSCNGVVVKGRMGLLSGHNDVLYAIHVNSRG